MLLLAISVLIRPSQLHNKDKETKNLLIFYVLLKEVDLYKATFGGEIHYLQIL